jgi:hypothetical protein
MSYTYNGYVAGLANMLVIPVSDPNFQTVIPNIIDDAEQRIYRELDILNAVIRDQTGVLTPNSRNFTLPSSVVAFVGTESINLFGNLITGRQPLIATSREFIDANYGSEIALTTPSLPGYYAMLTDQTILVGPSPDQAYGMEVIGWGRPTPLSATNPTTYLTLNLPDLFLAESLIFGYGYMKDFGAAADDPQGSVTWSSHYDKLWQSANAEEARKRYSAQGWTSKQPAPLATPARV